MVGGLGGHMQLQDEEFARTCQVLPLWKELRHLGTTVKYARGATLFREGDELQCLHYVLKGEVRMERLHMDGTEKTYWFINPGCVLGETPLFHRMPSRLTAVFRTAGEVCSFPREVLLNTIFPQYPELAEDMFRNMAWKIRVLTNQIATLSMDDLAVRICKYLHLHTWRNDAGQLCSRSNLTQQDLANLLGVHRVTCNRVLRSLERAGVISEFCRETVHILNEEAFHRYLSGEGGAE